MARGNSGCLICFLLVVSFGDIVSSMDIDDGLHALCLYGSAIPSNDSTGNDTIYIGGKCEAFYKSYLKYAANFIDCELNYSRPFRICKQCLVQYELASTTYQDFSVDEDLAGCRRKYMKADRVQIIPSMQTYIEKIWRNAACSACAENVKVNPCTGKVNYSIPIGIVLFMDLFQNLSVCMNTSLEDGNIKLYEYAVVDESHNFSVCKNCLDEYNRINDHYNSMSSAFNGDMCMDIVDRMNYTRLIWSQRFGCSCRSGESLPVILIAVLIGVLPIFFYGILRYKGKGKKSKVVKQKRLASHSITPLSQSLVNSLQNASTNLAT